MKYVNLGNSGLKVSRLALGCMSFGTPGNRHQPWVIGEDEARPIVRRAVEAGINFFDTADVYSWGSSEQITGKLLAEFLPREQAVIATKVFHMVGADGGPNDMGLSRKHILAGIDASLKRLGTDYVDLYIIHRFDYRTPIEETMEALHDVVRAGKARYIGASSMFTYQFAMMQEVARRQGWTRFVSMQNHYNLAWREEERDMNAYCIDTGVGLTPWGPLAGGFLAVDRRLTGQQSSGRARLDNSPTNAAYGTESDYRVVDALSALSKVLDVSMAEVALAWLLRRPGVSAPITGVTKLAQLDNSLRALEFSLTGADEELLSNAYIPNRHLGNFAKRR